MVQVPSDDTSEQSVTTGEFFEYEADLDREVTATFLREIADQLDEGTDLTMSGDDWEIPYTIEEPIEVEVQFESGEEDDESLELEVELEFKGHQEGNGGLTIK
jgi:amphi-Trp domain-containing protein